MGPAASIPLSGALAAGNRLGISAQNVANARSVGARPGVEGQQPYQPQAPAQQAVAGPDGQGLGTRVTARPVTPPFLAEFQPDSPNADTGGLVAAPNVDLAGERVEQLGSLRAYQANLAVLRAQGKMEREAMDILA